MVNAKCPGLAPEDLSGVLEGCPEDHALDVGGKSIDTEKPIVEVLQRCRSAAVAPPASVVGVHVKSRQQACSALSEGPKALIGVPGRCCPRVVPVSQQEGQIAPVKPIKAHGCLVLGGGVRGLSLDVVPCAK